MHYTTFLHAKVIKKMGKSYFEPKKWSVRVVKMALEGLVGGGWYNTWSYHDTANDVSDDQGWLLCNRIIIGYRCFDLTENRRTSRIAWSWGDSTPLSFIPSASTCLCLFSYSLSLSLPISLRLPLCVSITPSSHLLPTNTLYLCLNVSMCAR